LKRGWLVLLYFPCCSNAVDVVSSNHVGVFHMLCNYPSFFDVVSGCVAVGFVWCKRVWWIVE